MKSNILDKNLESAYEVFIGYSIKKFVSKTNRRHKPGCNIFTVDTSLSPYHSIIGEPGWETFGDSINSINGIRMSLETIIKLYNNLTEFDKSKYLILGFTIPFGYLKDIYGYVFTPGESSVKVPSYGYAVIAGHRPLGKLLGYDVVTNDVHWLSEITGRGRGWRDVEGYGNLNKNHLFTSLETAEKYTEYVNSLEDEPDGPSSPWGIYKVDIEIAAP